MSLWDQWVNDPKATQVLADPRYIAATKNFGGSVHDILYKYGFIQGADPSGNATGAIGANAYSVANMLKGDRATADHHSYNTLNTAGLEESGAAAGALNANNELYKRNVASALAAQTGELNTLGQGYTSEVANYFTDAAADPTYSTGPLSSAPVSYPPGTPSGTATALPTPQGPYTRTGPEAGGPVAKKLMKVGPQNVGLPGYR